MKLFGNYSKREIRISKEVFYFSLFLLIRRIFGYFQFLISHFLFMVGFVFYDIPPPILLSISSLLNPIFRLLSNCSAIALYQCNSCSGNGLLSLIASLKCLKDTLHSLAYFSASVGSRLYFEICLLFLLFLFLLLSFS
jgi:hypothetical protein